MYYSKALLMKLYEQADRAVDEENYNDVSLLQSQADLLYKAMENLETILAEQEG